VTGAITPKLPLSYTPLAMLTPQPHIGNPLTGSSILPARMSWPATFLR